MKIEVITTFYNDEFLAPFFLNHYRGVDSIRALIDDATTDDTFHIVRKAPNTIPEFFHFSDGMDDILKREMLNAHYKESTADWVVMVDSDEFLFIPPAMGYENVRDLLQRTDMGDVIFAKLFNVYRHISDRDIDPTLPALPQRRHGIYDYHGNWTKPCIVRGGKNIEFHVGNHFLTAHGDFVVGGQQIPGAHWCNADPSFCIPRRMRAMKRQSQRNLKMGLSIQHHNITPEMIQEECDKHLYDEEVF